MTWNIYIVMVGVDTIILNHINVTVNLWLRMLQLWQQYYMWNAWISYTLSMLFSICISYFSAQ
jgi:hypothetical protein